MCKNWLGLLNSDDNAHKLRIEIQVISSSLCRLARVRRREGEKRLTGLDATSSPLERQIREKGEAAGEDEEDDVGRNVVRNDNTIIFTLLPGAIIPGILSRYSFDTHRVYEWASERDERVRTTTDTLQSV